MPSLPMSLRLLITASIITLSVAAIPLSFLLPSTERQVSGSSCATGSPCSTDACACDDTSANAPICVNLLAIDEKLLKCERSCLYSTDCPGDPRGCNTKMGLCGTCAFEAFESSMKSCQAVAGPQDSTSSSSNGTGNSPKGVIFRKCNKASDCISGCECFGVSPYQFCFKNDVFGNRFDCRQCNSASDCIGDGNECDTKHRICKKCLVKAVEDSSKACDPKASSSTSTSTSTQTIEPRETSTPTETFQPAENKPARSEIPVVAPPDGTVPILSSGVPSCRYKFCNGQNAFKIGFVTDKSFTEAICDLSSDKIGTVDQSGEALRIDGSTLTAISKWTPPGLKQSFDPSFFKTLPILDSKHAGVGHKTMQQNQNEYLKEKSCWILPFKAFQILDGNGNAREKHTDDTKDCVTFCTSS